METATAPSLSAELTAKRDRLLDVLRGIGKTAVAFSGGIDSTVVAKAAHLALGENAVAVTADSPSVPRAEIADARRLAEADRHSSHRRRPPTEFADPDYVRNDGSRCYFCKSELYGRIETLLPGLGVDVICSGANLDDQGDYRPGLKAAAEHGVRHPLQEAGFTKADVRALALAWGLPTWDKPASPCLSSRLAPGVEVTPERTARVEAAEEYLHGLGLRECRVRLHEGELARIEVPATELARFADAGGARRAGAAAEGTGLSFRDAGPGRLPLRQSEHAGEPGNQTTLLPQGAMSQDPSRTPTPTPLPAADALDVYFLEARSKLLDLAAILDRIGRGGGAFAVEDDPRLEKVRQALEVLHDRSGGRAERIQKIFSLDYDPNWEKPQPRQ